ncbi:MAG: MBL fold metallo-hydrolase [Fibrobacteres bacterium]|nr:MBL fold metallo-hydrolase [Fibrobacterota bacterium]
MATQLSQEIYKLDTRISNVYLVKNDSGAILVDSGYFLERPLIIYQLRRLLGAGKRLTAVLITHAHPDHDGNLNAITSRFGGDIYMDEKEIPYAKNPRRVDLSKMDALGFPDRIIFKTMTRIAPVQSISAVDWNESWKEQFGITAIPTPGHTPGSCCYMHHPSKTLFTGDALLTALPPWTVKQKICLPSAIYSTDYEQALTSVKNITELNFSALCTGHGHPILEDASQKVYAAMY